MNQISTFASVCLLVLHLFATATASAQPGALDQSFAPVSGTDGFTNAFAVQPDGKILAGGNFQLYDGVARRSIVRINPDGTLDSSFDPGAGANGTVHSLVVQPDGKVVVAGSFSSFNNAPYSGLVRLNADGSVDASFTTGTGVGGSVQAVALQPDGKLVIGGNFNTYNSTPHQNIARLHPDGSLDMGFGTGQGTNGAIITLALQPDGKLVIAGDFMTYNGISHSRIARLNTDGSLDTGFGPSYGADNTVWSVALQPDGKVLMGGAFITAKGVFRNKVARLNPDGTLDTGFNPGYGADFPVNSLALLPSGKVLIGGSFGAYNGTLINNLALLEANGSLDTTFHPGSGPDQQVIVTAVQSDGRILAGGFFTHYNGTPRGYLARIHGASTTGIKGETEDEAGEFTLYPNPGNGQFHLDLTAVSGGSAALEIYAVTGQLVHCQSLLVAGNKRVSTGPLPPGLYRVRIKSNNRILTRSLIVNP